MIKHKLCPAFEYIAEYLRDCIQHATGLSSMRLPPQKYEAADEFKVVPSPKWFLACYSRDVWTRLESLKASVTSVFGQIWKIDGTKKICRKLAGEVANSANFALNVGNKRGEILQSVMTSSEAVSSLQPLADGLVNRYSAANVDPLFFCTQTEIAAMNLVHQSFRFSLVPGNLCRSAWISGILCAALQLVVLLNPIHCMVYLCHAFQDAYLNGTKMIMPTC